MHTYLCAMDLACTYAMRNPELARQLAREALIAAVAIKRPDLAYRANYFLGVL